MCVFVCIYLNLSRCMGRQMIGFVLFYGISTFIGYLMRNPVYTYMLNMIWLD